MIILLIIAVFAIWVAGIPWFWHLQSRSRDIVKVIVVDRLMTIFWLPLYLITMAAIGVSYFSNRMRRRG